MTFEEKMVRIKKLQESGDVELQKYYDKTAEIINRYATTHDNTENRARKQFEWLFNFSCRQAEESNKDLWEVLSIYMIPEERHLIKPPDTLKNKKNIQDWTKKEFKPYFYECMINVFMGAFTNELSELKKRNKKGGKDTVAKTKPRSVARKAPIIKERKKLIDNGEKDEKVILKLLVKAFPDERRHYIQQTVLAEKYREADERRAQKPHALSP